MLALGAAVGLLAGMLGVGGGMVIVPILTYLLTQRGVPPALAVKMGIATSMATILFTSLSSVRAHHGLGAVRWAVVRAMAPGIVAGGLIAGAGVFALLKGRALAFGFAAFIGWMAVQTLRNRKPAASRALPPWWGQSAVGVAIGFASALVGAGGAFLAVPFMTRCNVPPRQAVGTASALGFPVALAGCAGYVISGWGLAPALPGSFGYLYPPGLAIISLASVSTAPLGARLAQRIDVALLKKLFAGLLFALALSMLRQGLAA